MGIAGFDLSGFAVMRVLFVGQWAPAATDLRTTCRDWISHPTVFAQRGSSMDSDEEFKCVTA